MDSSPKIHQKSTEVLQKAHLLYLDLMAKSYQDCIDRIGDEAQRIYDETLREKLELTHMGQSVVIDVDTGNYYLGETDYLAMKNAREQQPYGLYCIIDIGRVTRI